MVRRSPSAGQASPRGWSLVASRSTLLPVPCRALLCLLIAVGVAHAADAPQVVCDQQRDRVVFKAANPLTYPVSLCIEVASLQNMRASIPLPACVTLPAAAQSQVVLELTPIDAKARWHYGAWSSRWLPGRYDARPDDRVTYELPYAPGYAYWIVQGCNGEFSHQGQSAYDFDLPSGSAVHAARAGRVIRVKQDSDRHGSDPSYGADANLIWIEHSDGTIGRYLHLERGGAEVELGQQVRAGQRIGRSGNTGFSRAPHLHFDVAHPDAEVRAMRTVPTRFHTDAGARVELTPHTSPMRPDPRNRDRKLPRNALTRLVFTTREPIPDQPVQTLTVLQADQTVLAVAEIGARRAYEVEFRFYRGAQRRVAAVQKVTTQGDWDRTWVSEAVAGLNLRGQPCRVEVLFDGQLLGEAEFQVSR